MSVEPESPLVPLGLAQIGISVGTIYSYDPPVLKGVLHYDASARRMLG